MLMFLLPEKVEGIAPCVSNDTIREQFEKADVVFGGKVIAKESISEYYNNVQFEITQSIKGENQNFINITTSEHRSVRGIPIGGDPFVVGEEYLVAPILHSNGNFYVTQSMNVGCTNGFVIPLSDVYEEFKTPRHQIQVGILPNEIQCKDGLELIVKSTDGSPACVKPLTAEKLVERGWASN